MRRLRGRWRRADSPFKLNCRSQTISFNRGLISRVSLGQNAVASVNDSKLRHRTMHSLCAASILFLASLCGADEQRLGLWNSRAPVGDGKFEEADAWVTVHRPAKPNGTAIVICPGGGYGTLVKDAEGRGIAAWLNRHDITGVVLEYRLPAGRHLVPLLDAQRAIRIVRARAREWELDPARIGILGFSAGGHLATSAATHFDGGKADAADAVERQSCRPDFVIAVYPVVIMDEKTHKGCMNNLFGKDPSPQTVALYSNEKQVTAKTPPAFLAHAQDDKVVPPEHSRAFFQALQAHKVPAEYLELPSGGHGL